jgi:hypothetical protein
LLLVVVVSEKTFDGMMKSNTLRDERDENDDVSIVENKRIRNFEISGEVSQSFVKHGSRTSP